MFYPQDDPEERSAARKESSDSGAKPKAKKRAGQDKSAPKEVQAVKTGKSVEKKGKAEVKSAVQAEKKAASEAQKEPAKAARREAKPADEKKKGKAAAPKQLPADYVPRLLRHYRERVVPELSKRFAYNNVMMVPWLQKIVLNIGLGEASQNPKILDSASRELSAITGQKPVISRARQSISNFKLRKGMPIGCHVTLRRWQMYEFLDRLLSVAIPRIRDFRGLSNRSFDGRGNYTMGIKEQIIFPEIDIDEIERVHGLDITLVTTANTDEEAYALLRALGVPFRQRGGEDRDVAA